jgi:hypothetical protein
LNNAFNQFIFGLKIIEIELEGDGKVEKREFHNLIDDLECAIDFKNL